MKTDRRLSATALAFPFFFKQHIQTGALWLWKYIFFLKMGGKEKNCRQRWCRCRAWCHTTPKNIEGDAALFVDTGPPCLGGKNIWSEFIGKELYLNSKNDEIFSVIITYMGRWHLKPHQTFTWMCHFNPVKSAWTSTDRWPVEITEVAENAATHSNRPIIERGSVWI